MPNPTSTSNNRTLNKIIFCAHFGVSCAFWGYWKKRRYIFWIPHVYLFWEHQADLQNAKCKIKSGKQTSSNLSNGILNFRALFSWITMQGRKNRVIYLLARYLLTAIGTYCTLLELLLCWPKKEINIKHFNILWKPQLLQLWW